MKKIIVSITLIISFLQTNFLLQAKPIPNCVRSGMGVVECYNSKADIEAENQRRKDYNKKNPNAPQIGPLEYIDGVEYY